MNYSPIVSLYSFHFCLGISGATKPFWWNQNTWLNSRLRVNALVSSFSWNSKPHYDHFIARFSGIFIVDIGQAQFAHWFEFNCWLNSLWGVLWKFCQCRSFIGSVTYFLSRHLVVQSQQWKRMFKVNSKYARTSLLAPFWCLYCFEQISHIVLVYPLLTFDSRLSNI